MTARFADEMSQPTSSIYPPALHLSYALCRLKNFPQINHLLNDSSAVRTVSTIAGYQHAFSLSIEVSKTR